MIHRSREALRAEGLSGDDQSRSEVDVPPKCGFFGLPFGGATPFERPPAPGFPVRRSVPRSGGGVGAPRRFRPDFPPFILASVLRM